MAPPVAPAPYCTPFDLQDYLSNQGLQASLDDTGTGSGQWVYCTTPAAINATSLGCQPLAATMPAGNTLDFGGADMPQIVEVVLTAQANQGTTMLGVAPVPGAIPAGAMAIDGGVNAFELARMQKAISYAAAEINNYLMPRYQSAATLQQSWTVNNWATICAARWLRRRTGRPLPKGIEDDYKQAREELREAAAGDLQIGDIGTPVAEWPAWSNVIVDPRYWIRKARVQRSISETASAGPTGYAQAVDWASQGFLEI